MDLSFGMVPMGLRFVVVPISLVVCVCVCFFLRWRWWMWVCADGGRRCCCGSGCRWSLLQHSGWVVVGDDDDDDDSDKDWDEVIYYFNL